MAKNNTDYISAGKPKIGGAIWRAPYGTTLPTNATDTLDAAFDCVGQISEDGLVNTRDIDNEKVKGWGGDTIATLNNGIEDSFKFTMVQSSDTSVLKAVYNDDNVTGTLETGITINVGNDAPEKCVYVVDMVRDDKSLHRIVAPNAKLSELGDITYKDDEVIGFETTITCMPGDADFGYDTHKEYIIAAS